MSVKETDFTKQLKKELTEAGAILIVQHGGRFASGWPDRLVFHPLWHGLLELKGRTTKLGEHQAANIAKLWRRCPGGVYVVRHDGTERRASGYVQREDGTVVATFTSGRQLLERLHQLRIMANASSRGNIEGAVGVDAAAHPA